MKPKFIIIICFFISFVCVYSCKKKAGTGGKNSISGTVLYKNGVTGSDAAAASAKVSIAYGTSESTQSFNQTILTGNDGSYCIEGLNKGKYFITAEFTDKNGFVYSTHGYGIQLENKKKNLEVNIVLE